MNEDNKKYLERLKKYREVEIALLLHDIGKFQQHGQKVTKIKHQQLSAELIEKINLPKGFDKKRIVKLVLSHHDKESKVVGDVYVKISDRISAEMEREHENIEDPKRNLISIFSTYTISKDEELTLLPDLKYLNPEGREELCYHPLPLSISKKVIYPHNDCLNKDQFIKYSNTTWNSFFDEIISIPKNLDYDAWITTVEALLKKYTFNVISAGYYTKPSISLYNHLIVSAAIARSLVEFEGEKINDQGEETDKKYLIIKGDINGIQKFIFKIKNPQLARKETSKRLRGRSFVIQLLSYATLRYILDKLSLSNTSIFIDAGGNFEIIAPNTNKNKELLSEALIQINNELMKKFNGDLRVTLAFKEVRTNEIKKYEHIEMEISSNIQDNKYRPFGELIFDVDGKWNKSVTTQFFEPKKVEKNYSKCPVCGSPKPKGENICNECNEHARIGEAITRSGGILVIKEDHELNNLIKNKDYYVKFSILGYLFYFVDNEKLNSITKLISSISDSNEKTIATYLSFSSDNFFNKKLLKHNVGLTFKFLGISLPKDKKNNLLTFDFLSKFSIDHEAIGVFKADIDNLGYLLMKGKVGEDRPKTLATFRELSMRIDLFFSGYISTLALAPEFSIYSGHCNKHKQFFRKKEIDGEEYYRVDFVTTQLAEKLDSTIEYNKISEEIAKCEECNKYKISTAIYSVFAGGDDIALTGPWDMIVLFSYKFRKELQNYVANNPLFTISAGIDIFDEKYPIGNAIKEAEEMLERSKTLIKDKKRGIPVKNSITVFDDTVLWELNDTVYPYLKDKVSFGDFFSLLRDALIIEAWVRYKVITENTTLSRSFIYTLYQLWEQHLGKLDYSELPNKRTEHIGYYPILAYHIGRRFSKKQQQETKEAVYGLLSKNMPWMKIVSSWVLYRTKKLNEVNNKNGE